MGFKLLLGFVVVHCKGNNVAFNFVNTSVAMIFSF